MQLSQALNPLNLNVSTDEVAGCCSDRGPVVLGDPALRAGLSQVEPFGLDRSATSIPIAQCDDLFMTGATAEEVRPLIRDFHYSRRMPGGGVHHYFAWRRGGGLFGNHGQPVAAAIYSQPVNRNFPTDALELSRLVRSDDCAAPLSSFVAWTLRWLRANTGRPFVLSYADPNAGHHGGIYIATGFTYVGAINRGRNLSGWTTPDGAFIHRRTAYKMLGSSSTETVELRRPDWRAEYGVAKHLYLKPLRERVAPLLRRLGLVALPFPRDPSIGRPAPSGVSQEHTLGVAPTIPPAFTLPGVGTGLSADLALPGGVSGVSAKKRNVLLALHGADHEAGAGECRDTRSINP